MTFSLPFFSTKIALLKDNGAFIIIRPLAIIKIRHPEKKKTLFYNPTPGLLNAIKVFFQWLKLWSAATL